MNIKMVNVTLFLIAPFIAIFHTLLAMNLNSELLSFLGFMSYVGIFIGVFLSFKFKKRLMVLIGAISFFISSIFHVYDFSTDLFLGKEIAYDYLGETPGFTEVKLYENNKATIGFGGIFGLREIIYLNYTIMGNTVILLRNDSSLSIDNSYININMKKYDIKFKTKGKNS